MGLTELRYGIHCNGTAAHTNDSERKKHGQGTFRPAYLCGAQTALEVRSRTCSGEGMGRGKVRDLLEG